MSDGRAEAVLEGRSTLVTGASRGIGEATARVLAGAGARVALVARTADRLDRLAHELGGQAVALDLTDPQTLSSVLSPLFDEKGAPDILVNAAGVFDVAPLGDTDDATLLRNLEVNLTAAFRVVRTVLPSMLARGSGLVINVGSVAGRRAFPGNAAYSASKYGLRGMHEVLVEEVRGTGVRACLIEPSATDTTLWDTLDPDHDPALPSRSDMLAPEDVAEAILFACTRPAGVSVPLIQIARG